MVADCYISQDIGHLLNCMQFLWVKSYLVCTLSQMLTVHVHFKATIAHSCSVCIGHWYCKCSLSVSCITHIEIDACSVREINQEMLCQPKFHNGKWNCPVISVGKIFVYVRISSKWILTDHSSDKKCTAWSTLNSKSKSKVGLLSDRSPMY